MNVDDEIGASGHEDIRFAVEAIHAASQQPLKERPDVSALVDQIARYAQVFGLQNDALDALIDSMLGNPRLDNSVSNALTSNLYPASKVPSSCVYGIVSKLGPGANRAAPAVQTGLLRWLVLVSDVLEDSKTISRVYGALFSLLDMTALRDSVCHILCTFTEPRHVKPFRVKVLLELAATPNAGQYVTALLSAFHAIRPDLMPEEACAGKSAALNCPDPAWRDRLEAIQHGPILAGSGRNAESQFRVAQRQITNGRRGRHLVETELEEGGEALESVTGIRDFVEKLPRIVRPTDMEAVLDDPLLQHYMATGPDDIGELDAEVDAILKSQLAKETLVMKNGHGISPKAIQTLRKTLEYAQFQKFLPGSVEDFIFTALEQKPDIVHLRLFLELLSWRYPDSHSWADSVLPSETEKRILEITQGSSETLLKYYTLVLRNRTAMFMSGTSAFEGSPEDSPSALVAHCSRLALSVLARSQKSEAKESVLCYLHALASISSHATTDNPIPIFNIETPLVYLLLFSNPNVSDISTLLSLLADYKKVFDEIVGPHPNRAAPAKYPSDFIKRLNGVLMDCCNLFWRSRAFSKKADDKNAAGCLLKESTQTELSRYLQSINSDYSLTGSFSLACNTALAGLAAATWGEVEASRLDISESTLIARRRRFRDQKINGMDIDGEANERNDVSDAGAQAIHFGPVSRLSLQRLEAAGGISVNWSRYRMSLLDWLDLRGMDGVSKLMKRTMKLLMDKPKGTGLLTPVATVGNMVQPDTPMTG